MNNEIDNMDSASARVSIAAVLVVGVLVTAFFGPFLIVLITAPELSAMEGKNPIPVIVILMLGFVGLLNSGSILNGRSTVLRLDKETKFDLKFSFGCSLLIATTGLIVAGAYAGKALPVLVSFN
ncbi:MAG: hypothetical protein CMF12_13700 [Idiomarina sp.]|uniref:hypothetical protein n=1 Tax=Idiomarina sp. TaxID=1874361 RepID=UPI000C5C5E17|nr:hypothetical protein [Idiomarina sp.]MBT43560.1 hypothetical protein [Idiomarina sp.]